MKTDFLKRLVIPPGPILSLTLIGIMLLSGLLYYRAIKVQRFLEPALAFSQPRNEFTDTINTLLGKELEQTGIQGVRFMMGSIVVDRRELFNEASGMNESAALLIKRLGNVFLSALNDQHTRSRFGLILIVARFPGGPDPETNRRTRLMTQERAEMVLHSLFGASPALQKEYAAYFAAAAIPADPSGRGFDRIEFRIIPSEQLHIEVLQRLQKYVH